MKAIIEVDIPEYQIEQEVSVYFKDTMMVKGKTRKYNDDEKDNYLQGYSDAMKEHKLLIKNTKEYMDKYNYAKAMESYKVWKMKKIKEFINE